MTPKEAITLIKECGLNIEGVVCTECEKVVLSALEKQIPRKLYSWNCTIEKDFFKVECPACLGTHISRYQTEYCVHCGQKFDWSEIEECIDKE